MQTIGVRMPSSALAAVDAWIARQPEPTPSRPEAMRKLVERGLVGMQDDAKNARLARSDATRADAERARIDHRNAQVAEYEKTARLRQVRLAKEEHDRRVAAGEQKPGNRSGAARAKELAVGAVREALATVDAPLEEKIERKRKLVAPPATAKIATAKPGGDRKGNG